MECRKCSNDRTSPSARRPARHRALPFPPSHHQSAPVTPLTPLTPFAPRAPQAPQASHASQAAQAVDLLIRVASVIPLPDPTLGADLDAWAAFDALIDDAALLLISTLGPEAQDLLRPAAVSLIATDPVCRLLLERALDAPTEHGQH